MESDWYAPPLLPWWADSKSHWHKRFLELAEHVSHWSKDPSTRCGAVIVRLDKTVCSVGYNGFPRGVKDHSERLENREEKYLRIIHAEMNAILHARERLDGYIMYCHPGSLTGSCNRCAAHIIQAGIKVIVFEKVDNENVRRRNGDPTLTLEMFKEAGVLVLNG